MTPDNNGNEPVTYQLTLRGNASGCTIGFADQELTLPWSGVPTLIRGLVQTLQQQLVPFIRVLIAKHEEQTADEYRLCRWDGAAWAPVLDDGITPDPTAIRTHVWRPGQDQSGFFPRRS